MRDGLYRWEALVGVRTASYLLNQIVGPTAVKLRR
jgi:hypothetical protein